MSIHNLPPQIHDRFRAPPPNPHPPIHIFIACGEGLETMLAGELVYLGYESLRVGFRGVYVTIPRFKDIYRINYCSRIASRVLLPMTRFRCLTKKMLYDEIVCLDWEPFFAKVKTFVVDANVNHRSLRNSLFAAQVVKDAICDQLRAKTGHRPSIDTENPDLRMNLFIDNDLAVLSLDTSGGSLHKRGYRQEAGEAPLQETLAAALLYHAHYYRHYEKGNCIFLDPCCGSGTLLIEAALLATSTPPGYLRKSWGFMRHPDFSMNEWLKVKNEADALRKPLLSGKLFGIEKDARTLGICKANLKAAGFHREIEVQRGDFQTFTPSPLPNFIMANPPHGRRLENGEDLRPLYRSLGDFMKHQSAKPAKGFVFVGNLEMAKEVGLRPKKRLPINNNGVDSRLLEFDLFDSACYTQAH